MINNQHIQSWWLGHPSEKYDFVNWDDDRNPIVMGKQKMATKPSTSQSWGRDSGNCLIFSVGRDALMCETSQCTLTTAAAALLTSKFAEIWVLAKGCQGAAPQSWRIQHLNHWGNWFLIPVLGARCGLDLPDLSPLNMRIPEES